MDGLPETDRDCPFCEDETYLRDGSELVCPECAHTPSYDALSPTKGDGPWIRFRRRTEQYSGFYGPERIKAVGGFASAYTFDEDF